MRIYSQFEIFSIIIVLTFCNDDLGREVEAKTKKREAKRFTIMQRIGTFMAMIPVGLQVITSQFDIITAHVGEMVSSRTRKCDKTEFFFFHIHYIGRGINIYNC